MATSFWQWPYDLFWESLDVLAQTAQTAAAAPFRGPIVESNTIYINTMSPRGQLYVIPLLSYSSLSILSDSDSDTVIV